MNLIFKREEMKIAATEIILPSYLAIKWETVGWIRTQVNNFQLFDKIFDIFRLRKQVCRTGLRSVRAKYRVFIQH